MNGGKKLTISRRDVLKGAIATGIGLALPLKYGVRSAYAAANSPQLTKWAQPIRGLGGSGIPVMSSVADPIFPSTNYYRITEGEFVDTLHPALGPTRLWGYWDTTNPVKRHMGGVIIATRGTASRIRFTNNLPARGLIPVDPTIMGAHQAQNRTAIHLHGGLVPWITDGGPFDWWTPGGTGYSTGLSFLNGPGGVLDNIIGQPMSNGEADYFYPNDQSTRLVWYHDHAHGITRTNAYAGLASGYLILDSAMETALASKIPSIASTIPLIFQDKVFVDSATIRESDPSWVRVARADVQSTGSLWYRHIYDPNRYKRLTAQGRFLTPPDPSVIPEFFGDTMLCNGLVYPVLTVEPKAYRFLLLNACNARFLNVNLVVADGTADGITLDVNNFPTNPAGPDIYQIGTEGGYLVSEAIYSGKNAFNPVTLQGQLIMGNAERADIIIDFTGIATNTEFILYNDAPGPFPGGDPENDYFLGNPLNPVQPIAGAGPDTRQILKIKVVGPATDPVEPRPSLNLPLLNPSFMDPAPLAPIISTVAPIAPLVAPQGTAVRDLTLNEEFDQYGRLQQLLGTATPGLVGKGFGLEYLASPTEVVNSSTVEVWRIFNLTADTHPVHFHLVNVQVLSRQPFRVLTGRFTPTGSARGPEPNELGWKETVQMHPGEVISIIMKFDLPVGLPFTVPSSPRAMAGSKSGGMGLPAPPSGKIYHEYVWHCHILEHEEHDMMRPLVVVG
jgi:spore coat protein A